MFVYFKWEQQEMKPRLSKLPPETQHSNPFKNIKTKDIKSILYESNFKTTGNK